MKKNNNILLKTWYQQNSYNYELYCIEYHRNNTNHETWHWINIAESDLFNSGFITNFNKLRLQRKKVFEETDKYYNIIREYGLDGLSFDGNTYHGIQCKLYNENNYLTASDLGTFINVITFRMKIKNPLTTGYLYHTSKLEVNLRDDIDNSEGQIVRNLLPYNETIQNIFFKNHIENRVNDDKTYKVQETNFTLRAYQEEAINTLDQEWNGVKLLNLPPGTGKTIIFCNHVKRKEYKNIFIISPLKIHVKQNLERIKEFLPNYETLLLDSDIGGYTDFQYVKNILDKKSIISTTFDSAENVLKQLFYVDNLSDYDEDNESDYEENDEEDNDEEDNDEEDNDEEDNDKEDNEEEKSLDSEGLYYKTDFDLSDSILIVDEAHNLINKDDLIKIISSFPKVLLVTGTPPNSMEEVIGCDVIYQYPFRKAIEEKYICDYQIYLPLLTVDEHTGHSKVYIENPTELNDLDNNLTQKCLYLINGMLQSGSRKCISYLSSQEECNQFINVFNEVMRKYHYLPFWIKSITNEVYEKNRKSILDEFQKDDIENSLKIICSIRILNEGIDIPNCDSVFIGNVGDHSSDITMVQRICRANRLVKERPNKIANCFLWTDDLNKIVNSLSLLKENDIEFHKKIKIMNGNYDKQSEKIMIEKIEEENKRLNDFIQVKCMTFKELWEIKKNLLFEFCNMYKRLPKKEEEYKNIRILRWLYYQKKKINSVNNDIYIKLSINEYVKKYLDEYLINKEKNNYNNKELYTWEEKKNLLFEFCNLYKRLPQKKEEYKKLNIGTWWIHCVKTRINSINDDLYQKIDSNKYVKESLDNYLKKKEDLSSEEKKQLLFEFCNLYQRVPKREEEYKNVKIGILFNNQKINIKNIKNKMYQKLSINKYIKESLDNYLEKKEKNKLKEDFTWEEKKEILFEFCNTYKKFPKQEEEFKNIKIGKWLINQLRNKKNNTNLKNICVKLSINEYVKVYIDNYFENKNKGKQKFSWDKKKEVLFEFCNTYKKVPTQKDKYNNLNIGTWFLSQKNIINSIEDDLYEKLSMNKYIKSNLDNYLKEKKDKKDKKDKIDFLFKFCDINKRTPILKEEYENVNIGILFSNQKNNINNIEDELYKKLSENIYVKKSLDEYLINKENKLTWEDKKELLFEFCNLHKRTSKEREEYKNVKIGNWLHKQKTDIKTDIKNDKYELYEKLSINPYVKKSLDKYLKKNNKNN